MHKAREYFKTMNTMRWLNEVAEYIAAVAAEERRVRISENLMLAREQK